MPFLLLRRERVALIAPLQHAMAVASCLSVWKALCFSNLHPRLDACISMSVLHLKANLVENQMKHAPPYTDQCSIICTDDGMGQKMITSDDRLSE